MNWDDLKFVLALAEAGTLSGAARALDVSHATVARRVAAFEEELPSPLFEKSPAGYEVTALGMELLDVARAMQTQMFRLERVLSAWEAAPTGRVRVAVPGFFGPTVSAQIATAVRTEHPEIMLELYDGQTYANLRKQEADLAIRLFLGRIEDDPSVRIRKIGDFEWSFFAREDLVDQYDLSYPANDLSGVPMIRHSDLAPANPGFSWLKEHASPLNVVLECNSLNASLACAVAGLGACCLPDFAAKRSGLVRLTDPLLVGFGAIAMHPDMSRSPRVRLMAEFLMDVLQRDGMPFSGGA